MDALRWACAAGLLVILLLAQWARRHTRGDGRDWPAPTGWGG